MKRRKIMFVCLFLCLSTILLAGCDKEQREPEFSQVGAICELATLKCYYHNVAEYESGKNGFLGLDWSHNKLWIEYGGIVKIGVDVSKVYVSKPDETGLVKVIMPKAKVLEIDLDENSINEWHYQKSLLAPRVTAEDQTGTLGFAQENMRNTAQENQAMLIQGQVRAKKAIEGYIQKVGVVFDRVYTVEWVEVE